MLARELARLCQLEPNQFAQLIHPDAPPPLSVAAPAGRAIGPKEPPSAVRIALALLVQNPGLAAQIPEVASLGDSEQPGTPLLRTILRDLQQSPVGTTAALLERFRGSEHEAVMAKLAVWEHPVLTQDVEAEFRGVLDQIAKTEARRMTDKLLNKQRSAGLDEAEKAELARLLAVKGIGGNKPATD
jgi:DNA primase